MVNVLEFKVLDQQNTIMSQQGVISHLQTNMTRLTNNHVIHNDTLAALEARINTQQLSLFDFQTQLSTVKSRDHSQDGLIASVAAKNNDQDSQIAALHQDVVEALHVETGVLDCGGTGNGWKSGSFPGIHYGYGKLMSQQFKTAYSTPPKVFLSLRFVGVNEGKHGYYGFVLKDVTSSGFDIICEGYNNLAFYIDRLEVSWISVAA